MIIRRPSLAIKTPYVSDVVLLTEDVEYPPKFPTPAKDDAKSRQKAIDSHLDSLRAHHQIVLAHAPALDCAGIVVHGSRVYCTPSSASSKTDYAIQHCEELREDGTWARIGYHPALAETMARKMLQDHLLDAHLGNYSSFLSQQTFGNSRVDYLLEHPDNSFTLLEVKNGVGADYPAGLVPATRSPVGVYARPAQNFKRTAIFPHGSKKPGIGVVSDRAIKHVHELTQLHNTRDAKGRLLKSAILFVVNRGDCLAFRPCHEADMLFAQVLLRAKNRGVTILAASVAWDEGTGRMGAMLPVEFDEAVKEEDLDETWLERVLKFNEEGSGRR